MDEQEEYLRAALLRDTDPPATVTITLRHHGRTYTLTDIPTVQLNTLLNRARDRGFTLVCNACHQARGLDPDGYCYRNEGKRCS